ncbi:MAG: flavodoxin family protein [Bacteroidaceae bacterium]|nr:flavodoxin family protein [Bacteroidaceae bacterium]
MKVLLINGSPRKEGNTHLALMEAAKQLEKNGIETKLLEIGATFVRGCIACNQCKIKPFRRCVFDDDLCNQAISLMEGCDGLIVGSPTYYGQPNGTLLSLIQRMSYAGSHVMQNKPAAAVAVCRRGGASAVYQTLLMPFQMQNMPIVTSQYWNIVYGAMQGQAELDAEGMQTMRTMADNMAWLLKKIHADGTQDIPQREPKQVTSFIR